MMKRAPPGWTACAAALAFTLGGVASAHAGTGATASFAPNDPPGEWLRQARDYANTRFSPLDQIKKDNVGHLRVAWTFSDGAAYGHEGAPLVEGDTMYVVTPFPNIAYALDLSKPGSPVKWTYKPDPTPMAARPRKTRKVP